MIIKLLRNAVGAIIVFFSWLTKPKGLQRTPEQQAKIQESLKELSLYQFFACPFCVKTRRALQRLNVDVSIKDINKNQQYRKELEQGGGKVQVPCLRIEEKGKTQWMYESSDIIQFLENRVKSIEANI